MLRSPRPLPQRYNRKVTPQTRRLVERKLARRKQFALQRWQRLIHRIQRKFASSRRYLLGILAALFVGFCALFVGLALFSPMLEIREIRVLRTEPRVNIERIQQALAPLFGEHLFFLSTQQDVLPLIQKAVPDLQAADVRKQYPAGLIVRITLHPLASKLVIEEPDSEEVVATASGAELEPPQGVDFLTDNGMYVVYNESHAASASGLTTLNITDWGVRPTPWTMLFEPEFLEIMNAAEKALREQFGQTISSRTAFVRGREFHLKTPQYELWFDMRTPVEEHIERYRMFLQTVEPGTAKEYVDLRLKDKIVYK